MNYGNTIFWSKLRNILLLIKSFSSEVYEGIEKLANELLRAWKDGSRVYICGNGGSAANAIHLANDLHYGIGACGHGAERGGLRIEALSANTAIITCLANDISYDDIFSHQLSVKEIQNILIVLSGSGNSSNVVNALNKANDMSIKSFAITAFSGGLCKELADTCIYFPVNDMQVAEDTQLIVGHICMQWLSSHKPDEGGE